jgi:hypothetical protein
MLLTVFVDLNGHDGGFVYADALSFDQNQSIGRPQVDSEVF